MHIKYLYLSIFFSFRLFFNFCFLCRTDQEEKAEREQITEDSITLKSLIGEKMEDAKAAVAKEAEKAARMEASLALNEEKCQTLTSLNEHLQQQITLVNSGFASYLCRRYTNINSLLLQNEQMHSEKERTLDAELVNLKSLFEDNKLALVEERAKYFKAANF
jgi:hypothetical protein